MSRSMTSARTRRRSAIVFAWAFIVLVASTGAARIGSVVKGGSDGVPGSESIEAVDRAVAAGIPAGNFYSFLAVLHSDSIAARDPRFAAAANTLADALSTTGRAAAVRSYWNTGDEQLLGRSGKTALLLVHPRSATFGESELATADLRRAILAAHLSPAFACEITGQPAVLYDLNQRSSTDLLRAERIGLPITLAILLIVFGSPVAALVPVVLALCAMTISMAALYLLSGVMVVSVFAENTVSMIGLGIGVDYSLFLLARFRAALASGATADAAARRATREVAPTIIYSGVAVAIGFAALSLVRLPFLKALTFGGIAVVITSILATLTLLPALLAMLGTRINWPRQRPCMSSPRPHPVWSGLSRMVNRRPLICIAGALLILGIFVMPVFRMTSWNLGASSLDADLEARRGYDTVSDEFAAGWMGPTAIVIQARPGESVLDEPARAAIGQLVDRLHADPRISAIRGYPQLIAGLQTVGTPGHDVQSLPEPLRAVALDVVGRSGEIAVIALITTLPPEAKSLAALVDELRADSFPELSKLGMTVRISGTPAMLTDFSHEIFSKLWIVIPVVLLVTFCALLLHFKSLVVPLKAIAVNLLSVLASYGFVILVFQDGHGASVLGLVPPGGINAFIVLVLFTILFGLSMDYEVFLLSSIKAAYERTGDNRKAVTAGLLETAGIVSSAAFVMVSLFLSFGFTRLIATREFGLGLAFAVALDATLIRLVLVPALMILLGRANWWLPRFGAAKPVTSP
jgi:putative drug exporter of the RND superfamily